MGLDLSVDMLYGSGERTEIYLFIYGTTPPTLGGQKPISFKTISLRYIHLAKTLAKANQPFFWNRIQL